MRGSIAIANRTPPRWLRRPKEPLAGSRVHRAPVTIPAIATAPVPAKDPDQSRPGSFDVALVAETWPLATGAERHLKIIVHIGAALWRLATRRRSPVTPASSFRSRTMDPST